MPAPMFSPAGGVGSTYKDPKTGEVYKFTAQGWVKQTQDIKKETTEQGTFEIKPEEQQDVEKLKGFGLNEEAVQRFIAQKRSGTGTQVQQEQIKPEEVEEPEKDMSNPFGGMTKQEMLRDAFNKGVRKKSELENLSGMYDILVGEDEETIDIEDFESLSPKKQEETREKLKKMVITKGQELGTGTEREGVLGTLGTFDTGQELIDNFETVGTGLGKGLVRGGISVFGKNIIPGKRTFGKTTPEEDYLDSLMTVYTAQFIKAISGTQVSDEERRSLNKALPSEYKTVQNNIAGIKAIEEFLSNAYSVRIGVDLEPLRSEPGKNDPARIFRDKEEENPLGI